MYESSFNFAQSESHKYKSLVILPKLINKHADINYWMKYTYTLYVCVNDKWFEFPFTLNIPELNISFGKLEYKYEYEKVRQMQDAKTFYDALGMTTKSLPKDEIGIMRNFITGENSSIDATFNAFMYLPSLINVDNIKFTSNVIDYANKGNLLQFASK